MEPGGAAVKAVARFECLGGVFARNRLYSLAGAETGDGAPERALRRFLSTTTARNAHIPRDNWLRLTRGPDRRLYGRRSTRSVELAAIIVQRSRSHWSVANFGECMPLRVVEGYEVARVRLAVPARPRARELKLSIRTGTCYRDPDAEQRAIDRVSAVRVNRRRSHLGLLALLRPERPLPAGEACAGYDLSVVRQVHLARPLGRLRVVDDATAPPTPLTKKAH